MGHSLGRGLIASMLGAATGTVLALSLGYFWLIGAFVGGLMGYLSYDVEEVLAVAPRVWRATLAIRISSPCGLLPSRDSLVSAGWSFLAFTLLMQTVMSYAILIVVGVPWLLHVDMSALRWGGVLWCLIGVPLVMGAFGVLMDLFFSIGTPRYRAKTSKDAVSRFNIVSVTIFFATTSYQAVSKFLPQLFREVYSEPRLIVGVSALLGSVTGFYAKSWLIGSLVCGALYLFQHQLIYKRLKFAKAK